MKPPVEITQQCDVVKHRRNNSAGFNGMYGGAGEMDLKEVKI
jgi:hypothetical protein